MCRKLVSIKTRITSIFSTVTKLNALGASFYWEVSIFLHICQSWMALTICNYHITFYILTACKKTTATTNVAICHNKDCLRQVKRRKARGAVTVLNFLYLPFGLVTRFVSDTSFLSSCMRAAWEPGTKARHLHFSQQSQ